MHFCGSGLACWLPHLRCWGKNGALAEFWSVRQSSDGVGALIGSWWSRGGRHFFFNGGGP